MNIRAECKFHGVGQGLFYSMVLVHGQKDSFTCVYDCGSSSEKIFLNSQIDQFKMRLKTNAYTGKKHIDMLVLSHLHRDHINGLDRLLQDVIADRVILPYFHPEQLLLYACDAVQAVQFDESNELTQFEKNFYSDPVRYFLSKETKHIYIAINETDWRREESVYTRPYMRHDETLHDNETDEGDRIKDDLHVAKSATLERESYGDAVVETIRANFDAELRSFKWIFVFENMPLDGETTWEFYRKVKAFCSTEHIEDIGDIVSNKARFASIVKIYKDFFGKHNSNLNRTSLSMYHSPCSIDRFVCSNALTGYNMRARKCCYGRNLAHQAATLLTGDLELKDDEELRNAKHRDRIGVLQVPHHGSNQSWTEFWHRIQPCVRVIPYGCTNGYGHPGGRVIRDTDGCENVLALVNEDNGFSYMIVLDDGR